MKTQNRIIDAYFRFYGITSLVCITCVSIFGINSKYHDQIIIGSIQIFGPDEQGYVNTFDNLYKKEISFPLNGPPLAVRKIFSIGFCHSPTRH